MPLRDELLNPIAGANPAGENLRYAPVYDKIKEARRQDDDAPQGDWQRERKLADWPLTIKLITEALSKKSKDLQLAAWLTEAMLRRDGVAGLRDGLDLLQGLIETFWENLYPEIEDGDAEFRAAPLQWVGDKLDAAVKNAPLTRSGLDYYQYKQSRAVGYEQDAAESESKATARQEAVSEGKITAEEFDQGFDASPKAWYVQLEHACDGVLEKIGTLSEVCDAQFGNVSPSFSRLREATEEVRQSVHILLQKKREKEPDIVEPAALQAEPEVVAGDSGTAVVRAPARRTSGEPADREDAVGLIVAAARFIRKAEPGSPAPYLMLRGFRWGELRAGGKTIDQTLLEAPPTEIRQNLKRGALQGNWPGLLEGAEIAMGMPYGRGWLDIQRYVCRACAELGRSHTAIGEAVQSELRTLLHDLPELPQMTLLDDTASASPDTLKWLRELGSIDLPEPDPAAYVAPAARPSAQDDVFDMATRAVAAGRSQEAIEMLSRELSRERSGRGRFQRKMQMAELCLSLDRAPIALPLLQDLAAEIDQRKLDDWESPDSVAHALSLLFRCLEKLEGSYEDKQRLYERICRLDPAQAMSCVL